MNHTQNPLTGTFWKGNRPVPIISLQDNGNHFLCVIEQYHVGLWTGTGHTWKEALQDALDKVKL